MTELISLDAEIRLKPDQSEGTSLGLDNRAIGDGPWQVDFDLEILDTATALQPRGARQDVAVRVLVDGMPGVGLLTLEQGDADILTPLCRRLQYRMGARAARLFAWLPRPSLTERRWKAPPPGELLVAIEMVYVLPSGEEVAFRLATDGLSVESDREIQQPTSPDEPAHLLRITGLGPMARYDRRQATLNLPAFHGESHGQILWRLAELGSVPPDRIDVDLALDQADRYRARRVDGPAFEVADAANAWVDLDALGQLVALPLVPGVNVPPVWTITLADLVAGERLRITSSGEVPTCLTITGRQQVPSEPAVQGLVTKVERRETSDTFQVPAAIPSRTP